MHELVELATAAALAGASAARAQFAALDTLEFEEKAGGKNPAADLVSPADRAVESVVFDMIRRHRPTDGFLGEESRPVSAPGRYTWVVDPIDGTLNFAYGRTGWAVSVACVDASGALAAAVVEPLTGRLYTAARDTGAFRNGVPITVRPCTDISRALVEVGRGRGSTRSQFASVIAALDPLVCDLRRTGSAALALAALAAGELDAVYGPNLQPWDMAAGRLIATEAGAVVCNADGAPADTTMLLAAAPGIIEVFRTAVRHGLSVDRGQA